MLREPINLWQPFLASQSDTKIWCWSCLKNHLATSIGVGRGIRPTQLQFDAWVTRLQRIYLFFDHDSSAIPLLKQTPYRENREPVWCENMFCVKLFQELHPRF